MKKLATQFIIIFMFLANLQAFSQHIDINTTKTLRKFPTWESRLGYVINGPGHAIIIKQGLELIQYKLMKNLNLDSLIACPVSAKDLIPIYPYNDSLAKNDFIISSPNNSVSNSLSEFNNRKKQIIHHHLNDRNMFPVKLKWNYKGHIFYTYCIISRTTQEVVYDNILSNIHTIIVSSI